MKRRFYDRLGKFIRSLPFGEKMLMTANIWLHEWHMTLPVVFCDGNTGKRTDYLKDEKVFS